jgi:hypothetical protein
MFLIFVLKLEVFSVKCPSNNSAELTMIKLLLNATPTKVKIYNSLNRAEITLNVIILDDKLNVELSAKSTDNCGHLTFRLKIQGERKILIVINANLN